MPLINGQNVIDWTQADPVLLEVCDFLVPHVQDFIVDYCKSDFLNSKVFLEFGNTLAFVHSEPDTITDSNDSFITNGHFAVPAISAGFEDAHIDISVRGSYNNDGIFECQAVADGVLTLADSAVLVVETPDIPVTIFAVKWPKGLPIIAARMVRHLLDKQAIAGIEEFSLGDWSTKYGQGVNVGSFPEGMIKSLGTFRQTRHR